jgi:hypothetical protein
LEPVPFSAIIPLLDEIFYICWVFGVPAGNESFYFTARVRAYPALDNFCNTFD